MDINFMCNYKGMLYPLQLEPPKKETSHLETLDLECPKFLVDLCAEKIVLDGASTLRATETIPAELCYSLMKAALLNTRDRAIEVRFIELCKISRSERIPHAGSYWFLL